MKRVGGWLGATKNSTSTHSLSALDEPRALEEAMAAVAHILNDDVDTAEIELSKGNSPFHKLGKGVTAFLRATLGFEQEVMREASERLGDSENSAYEHQRHADRNAYHSQIYPPGSEYALCLAESQLMGAVVAVLNESLSESIRGFYKLRKAYVTLQEIADAEKRYLNNKSSSSVGSTKSSRSGLAPTLPGPSLVEQEDEDEDLDFVDADEDVPTTATPTHYQGHLESEPLSSKMDNMSLKSGATGHLSKQSTLVPIATKEEDDFQDFSTHPIDVFIHSGSNLCFGILQLMLSLIPPAFSKLLYIIGFKGDRDAGISMLWRATKYSNVNGALAGLVTLGYYNVTIGFCDILRSDAYPKERCKTLLNDMRARYPQSRLWRLEEARMLAGEQKLEEAVEMTGTEDKSPLKQVEALQWFERSLNCMYLHRYEDCAKSFLKCVELNNWSHGLYYYIAGVCYIELYRQTKPTNPTLATKYSERATTLLRSVPANAGKKRFMARQLPFDAFVTRKISKWEDRAKTWGVDFADAVGVAPVEEIIYFWGGFKRMRPEHLEHSLQRLAWSEDATANLTWGREGVDETSILALLRAVVTARLGDTASAKRGLETGVLKHEWAEYKGGFKDNWTLPVAHYEMAVIVWVEAGEERGSAKELGVCGGWLEKAAKWESYDLDARVGMKVTTAKETLSKCGVVFSS